MQLYASLTSPYARKIRVILAEKGLDFELVEDSPWEAHTRVPLFNPLGKVPVLIDGQQIWFDSPVIAGYLELRAPEPAFLPADPLAALQVRQREALADGVTDAAVAMVLEGRRPATQQDTAAIARHRDKITRALDYLEPLAATRAQAPLDLADIALGCALAYVDFRLASLDWRAGHPALSALVHSLQQRPSFAASAPPA